MLDFFALGAAYNLFVLCYQKPAYMLYINLVVTDLAKAFR